MGPESLHATLSAVSGNTVPGAHLPYSREGGVLWVPSPDGHLPPGFQRNRSHLEVCSVYSAGPSFWRTRLAARTKLRSPRPWDWRGFKILCDPSQEARELTWGPFVPEPQSHNLKAVPKARCGHVRPAELL